MGVSKLASLHPLDGLTPEEIAKASKACNAYAKTHQYTAPRFCSISIQEPSRAAMAAFTHDGTPPPRQAFVVLTQGIKSTPNEVLVDVTGSEGIVRSWKQVEGVTVSLVPDDFTVNQQYIKDDPEVARLLKSIGLTPDEVEIATWPMHAADPEHVPKDRKQVQGFMYHCPDKNSNIYAYPLPWTPILDVETRKVVRIESSWEGRKLPPALTEGSDYASDLFKGTYRTDIKPINIEQPEGPSFTVDGSLVKWQKWEMRVGFDSREGMVLHDVGFAHGGLYGQVRPILHRASMPEMCVPYAEQQPPFHRRQAFDAGDAGFGFATNSLELGCDCVGHIHYFDAVFNNSQGEPETKKKVVCLHEEDAGLLWKHTEHRTAHCEQRRARRLVLSSICTLGNYDYSMNWYFYQDGGIQYEVKLTGILSTNLVSPADGDDPEWGTLMLPGVTAGYHQHLFIARLDWAVDNQRSQDSGLVVSEVDVELVQGPKNIYGSAFQKYETDLNHEKEAQRLIDPMKARQWRVRNPNVKHPITGKPVAFKLMPANTQPLLAVPGSTAYTRAGFARNSLWVTQANDSHRWPGGDYPLQNPNPGGLQDWVEEDCEITEPVTWHVFGATHIARPEDFPVMPVETTGFMLKPVGFFANNPTLDVPPFTNKTSKLHTCCPTTDYVHANGNGLANGHANSNGLANGHANGHANGNGVANGHACGH